MVEATVRAVAKDVPFRGVHAKIVRAEPVSALYEQYKCHHVVSRIGRPDVLLLRRRGFARSFGCDGLCTFGFDAWLSTADNSDLWTGDY